MLILFDDNVKESVKAEMQLQPILNTVYSKFFEAAWPQIPSRRPKGTFLAAARHEKVF